MALYSIEGYLFKVLVLVFQDYWDPGQESLGQSESRRCAQRAEA